MTPTSSSVMRKRPRNRRKTCLFAWVNRCSEGRYIFTHTQTKKHHTDRTKGRVGHGSNQQVGLNKISKSVNCAGGDTERELTMSAPSGPERERALPLPKNSPVPRVPAIAILDVNPGQLRDRRDGHKRFLTSEHGVV